MTKNRFLQHINGERYGIPHVAQRKLFPKYNFFHKNPQKVIEE